MRAREDPEIAALKYEPSLATERPTPVTWYDQRGVGYSVDLPRQDVSIYYRRGTTEWFLRKKVC
jgi:hypothetical protein